MSIVSIILSGIIMFGRPSPLPEPIPQPCGEPTCSIGSHFDPDTCECIPDWGCWALAHSRGVRNRDGAWMLLWRGERIAGVWKCCLVWQSSRSWVWSAGSKSYTYCNSLWVHHSWWYSHEFCLFNHGALVYGWLSLCCWSVSLESETVKRVLLTLICLSVVSTLQAKSSPPTYTVEREEYLARGKGIMKLPSGYYQVGHLSTKGMVVAIKDNTIKIEKPDGTWLYVIADDAISSGIHHTESPTPTPSTHKKWIT